VFGFVWLTDTLMDNKSATDTYMKEE